MKTIYKYTIAILDKQEVVMPLGSKILTVQEQNGKLRLWAMVDTDTKVKEIRGIAIYGTGNPMDSHMETFKYITTVQQHGGCLVWHVFEQRY